MSSSPSSSVRPPRWRKRALIAAAIVLVALAFALLTGLLDGGVGVTPLRLFDQPLYVLANAWPGLLFAGILLVLTRRLISSFSLAFLLQGAVYAVNALKMANLGTPLMPADFHMVGQLNKGGTHVLGGYLPHSPWPYLMILAGVACIVALWRYEPRLLPRRTQGRRTVAGGVLAVLLVTLLAGVPVWNKLYNGQVLWLEPWSATVTATHSGLVSSLMLYHLQYGQGRHKASPEAAMQLISQADADLRQRLQAAPNPSAMPDIVVVQSESYFDPSIMKGYEHANLTPNLHRLAQQGVSGALHVPTYGGGTIRTEFEMLTGLSLRYFDDLQFPYLQMNTKVVPGLVRTLRSHGYETVAIHGNDPSFWNRTTAFKSIGFDRFISQSGFPKGAPNDGTYMADSAMTDEIMSQLKNAGPPQFLFAISIEAHGPYDTQPRDVAARDAEPVPAGITGKDKLEMQNYLYHMGHADAELGRLAKLLAQRDRPTLLLFYGDHLPALTNSYNTAGFVNGKDMLSQAGTWLLVDPRNPGKAEHQDLASWMMPGKLLDKAGIHDDAYFALTQVIAPQLASLTRAPGAPPLDEDPAEKQTDEDMASVAQLRLKGRLNKLLPQPTAPAAANDGSYADGARPAASGNNAQGVQQ